MLIKPCWINPGFAKTKIVCGLMAIRVGLVVGRTSSVGSRNRLQPKYLYRNINSFDEYHMVGYSSLNKSGLNWTFMEVDAYATADTLSENGWF